ncbi:type III secretion system needle filament subunit SctF [Burkholderia pyrrocinia]
MPNATVATINPDDTYLERTSEAFVDGVNQLKTHVDSALSDLEGDSTNTYYLSQYQAAMSAYNIYTNAQSSTVKAVKDIDSAILSNFR